MEFAVVIPAFNDRDKIAESVRTALRQKRTAEVVVVDDGSTDDTAEVARSLGDRRVAVIQQANNGPGAARNAGAAAAASSHLVFLDADDHLMDGALDVFARAHLAGAKLVRTGVVLVGGDLAGGDGAEREWLADDSPWPFPRGSPLPGSFSVDRDTFVGVGGYDHVFRYAENSELLLRLALHVTEAEVTFVAAPTVRKIDRPGRPNGFYRSHRIDAAERMLVVHAATLRLDRDSLANHHAILSRLYRDDGAYLASIRNAVAAARCRPDPSVRDWARAASYLIPPTALRTRRRGC